MHGLSMAFGIDVGLEYTSDNTKAKRLECSAWLVQTSDTTHLQKPT